MSQLILIQTDAQLTRPDAIGEPEGGLGLDAVIARMAGASRIWLAVIDSTIVGVAAFMGGPAEMPEIGYGISPAFRGKGLAKHVVATLCATAKAEGLEGLTARTAASNPASGAVLKAGGFTAGTTETDPEMGDVIHWSWRCG